MTIPGVVIVGGAHGTLALARSLGQSMKIFKSEVKNPDAPTDPAAPAATTAEGTDTAPKP